MTVQTRRIYLFDVDGVLIEPLAYRLGIVYTLTELMKYIGLQNVEFLLPNENEISGFEANGVHDVWDLTNIVFCYVLAQIALQSTPFESLLKQSHVSVIEQLEAISLLRPTIDRPNYSQLAEGLGATGKLSHPPDIALEHLSLVLDSVAQKNIWLSLLTAFLRDTRSAYSSYGTRLFQNIILGTQDFKRTYDLEPLYQGAGLLRAKDRVLMSPAVTEQLNDLYKAPGTAVGVYTARPSLPPKGAKQSALGYSPEAEIALEQARLQFLPLIGMGMMEWLGKLHNRRTEDLTKPNTTQALAALINSVNGGDEVKALEDAYAIDSASKPVLETGLAVLKDAPTKVFLFEDTTSGIVPMEKVAAMLRTDGMNLDLVPLGIAVNEQKKSALRRHCQDVFEDVNQAFEFASKL